MNKPLEVFFSYAHEDEKLRDELAKHLKLLKREGVINDWHDRQIMPGSQWKDQIDGHLESADIILLLVSADFLDSDYCYDIEMKRALERHEQGEATVIPIILRPVDWQGAPFGRLQCLPKDAKPVTSWTNQDEAFLDIARGIRLAASSGVTRRPITDAVELAEIGRNKPVLSEAERLAPAGVSGNPKGSMPETVVARPYSGPRIFLSLLIAVLVAGGWWSYVFINKVDEIDSRITVADNLLNIGRYAEAKQAYEYALEIDPHNAEASWGQKKAAVWDIQEKPVFELAIKHLYEENPEDEHVNLFLGEFYATSPTRDENAKAIDYLKKAIELNPKVAEAYFDLGVLYEQSGKNQEAETNYQQAVNISHSTAKYLNNLAYLYFKQKDYQKALATYGKVSKFPLSALESAKIYWRLGKVDKAMEFQRLALEWLNDDALMLKPDQQKPWDFEFGKEEWLEQLFQTPEKKSYASLCLSVSQYLLGQTEEAAKTITNVREQKLTRQATIDQIMRKELEELALDYPTFAVQLDAYMKTYLPSKK